MHKPLNRIFFFIQIPRFFWLKVDGPYQEPILEGTPFFSVAAARQLMIGNRRPSPHGEGMKTLILALTLSFASLASAETTSLLGCKASSITYPGLYLSVQSEEGAETETLLVTLVRYDDQTQVYGSTLRTGMAAELMRRGIMRPKLELISTGENFPSDALSFFTARNRAGFTRGLMTYNGEQIELDCF